MPGGQIALIATAAAILAATAAVILDRPVQPAGTKPRPAPDPRTNLQKLDLTGNPLTDPLPDVIAQGITAVLAYLQGLPTSALIRRRPGLLGLST